MQIIARSPAKLILSGEHAVLYGAPAIATAVSLYSESRIKAKEIKGVLFKFLNLKYDRQLHFSSLDDITRRITTNYQKFLEGKLSIREVLQKPFELLQFTVNSVLNKFDLLPHDGFEIETHSDIPIGCGMGSSAASIVSTMYAMAKFMGLPLAKSHFMHLSRESENLQHGYSSGLDIYLCLHGGSFLYGTQSSTECLFPDMKLNLVNTGQPLSSTGDCVAEVKKHFLSSKRINSFKEVTKEIHQALEENNIDKLKNKIIDNNQLLVDIGVVPQKVQRFIRDIEYLGGAAKICGAGATTGDNSGVVLVMGDIALRDIVQEYDYSHFTVNPVRNGVHIV